MKTAERAPTAGQHQPLNVFGDPWNPPGTAASDLRTTLLVGAFLVGVAVFAASVSAWVSDLSPERPGLQQASSALPKAYVASASLADGEATGGGAAVSVLAPRNLTAQQSAEFAERFRATPDGYFAQISFDRYDVVINGSVSAAPAGAPPSRIRISETETGLAAMFSRGGADYLVDFSCRGPGAETGVFCLTEAEARAFVADLVETPAGGS